MLVMVALYNRIAFVIPFRDHSDYLDFYSGFKDRINTAAVLRTLELVAAIIVSIAVRLGLKKMLNRQDAEFAKTI